jgi:ribosomal protein S18 acetylase RimI-like enzyme
MTGQAWEAHRLGVVIRRLEPEETDRVVELAGPDSRMPPDEIRAVLADHDTWVCVGGNEIKGLVCTKKYSRDYGLRIFVAPEYRGQGIGRMLYEHVRPEFDGPGPDKITAAYRADAGDAPAFFGRRGYEPWFRMVYLSFPAHRQLDVVSAGCDIRSYSGDLFETCIRIWGITFYEYRKSHGFEPYDVRELHTHPNARADFAATGANTFVAFTPSGEAAGCASVEGDFIDTVGVLPEYQGRGYGRALTAFCIGHLRRQGFGTVRTSVLDDNLRAKALYLGMGFEHVVTYEDACLRLPDKRGAG